MPLQSAAQLVRCLCGQNSAAEEAKSVPSSEFRVLFRWLRRSARLARVLSVRGLNLVLFLIYHYIDPQTQHAPGRCLRQEGKKEGSDRPNASRSRTAAYAHTHRVYSKLRRRAITYTSTHPLGYVLFVSLSCLFCFWRVPVRMQASNKLFIGPPRLRTGWIKHACKSAAHFCTSVYNKEFQAPSRAFLARLVDLFTLPVTPVLRQLGSLYCSKFPSPTEDLRSHFCVFGLRGYTISSHTTHNQHSCRIERRKVSGGGNYRGVIGHGPPFSFFSAFISFRVRS